MTKLFDRLECARATIGVAVLVLGGVGMVASAPAAMAAEQAAAAQPATAQPAKDPRRSGTIEEVIVTSRMIEESAQDVPIAVTAISTEQLKSPTIRTLVDLNGFAPNVTLGADGSRGGRGLVVGIRGISPTRSDDNSIARAHPPTSCPNVIGTASIKCVRAILIVSA